MNEQKNEKEWLGDYVAIKLRWLKELVWLLGCWVFTIIMWWPAESTRLSTIVGSGITFYVLIHWRSKALREYWQRNVIGYTYLLWLEDREIKSRIFYGRKYTGANICAERRFPHLISPLGGWFRRPIARTGYSRWQLRKACSYCEMDRVARSVYLHDTADNCLRLCPSDALKIAASNSSVAEYLGGVANMEKRFGSLAKLAVDTVEAIGNTSRFQSSEEAKGIRFTLVRGLSDILHRGEPEKDRLDGILAVKPSMPRRVKRSKKVAVVEETPATEAAIAQQ